MFYLSRDVHIEKVSKLISSEKNYKFCIGYLYDKSKVKPLHIVLSKMSAYVKSYDRQTKWMFF